MQPAFADILKKEAETEPTKTGRDVLLLRSTIIPHDAPEASIMPMHKCTNSGVVAFAASAAFPETCFRLP